MDRFPTHQKRHSTFARKSSPYEGRQPASRRSSAYTYSPKIHQNHSSSKVKFEQDDPRRQRDSRGYGHNDQTLVEDDSSNEAGPDLDTDEPFFHWEEEATLLSELMEEGPKQSGDDDLDALADSLQGPFIEQGKLLKKDIAETLVSTNNNIKSIFGALKNNVDPSYGKGLAAFNKVCKEVETSVGAQKDAFRQSDDTTKVEIEKAFKILEQKYAERDNLWDQLFVDLDRIVEPAVEHIKGVPGRVERTIVEFEKRARRFEDESGTNSLKKGLQGLFGASL